MSMVVLLGASPTATIACDAVCLPSRASDAGAPTVVSPAVAGHQHHAPSVQASSTAPHHAAPSAQLRAPESRPSAGATLAAVGGGRHCPSGSAVVLRARSAVAARADAAALQAVTALLAATIHVPVFAASMVSDTSPPLDPPSPTRAPLVLRV